MKNIFQITVLILAAFLVLSFANVRSIRGKVTDSYGNPLPGVVVTPVPSYKFAPVTTKEDGTYVIEISEKTKKLVFSFMKYRKVEKKIEKSEVVDAKIAADPISTE